MSARPVLIGAGMTAGYGGAPILHDGWSRAAIRQASVQGLMALDTQRRALHLTVANPLPDLADLGPRQGFFVYDVSMEASG